MNFIVDSSKEMSCNYGAYTPHDGNVTINCANMDALETLIATILHEELHRLIDDCSDDPTTEGQDHYIIPRMLF